MVQPDEWQYDAGDLRRKHKWQNPEPGFVQEGDKAIGKCSATITPEQANALLNRGVVWPSGANPPEKIYNVHQGAVYRAEPTEPGKSYHGFPEKESKGYRVPRAVLLELAKKAEAANEYHRFRTWMREYLPEGWKSLHYSPTVSMVR